MSLDCGCGAQLEGNAMELLWLGRGPQWALVSKHPRNSSWESALTTHERRLKCSLISQANHILISKSRLYQDSFFFLCKGEQEVPKTWLLVHWSRQITRRKHNLKRQQQPETHVPFWPYLKCWVLNKFTHYLSKLHVSCENQSFYLGLGFLFFFFLITGAPGSISKSQNGFKISNMQNFGFIVCDPFKMQFCVQLAGTLDGHAVTKFLSIFGQFLLQSLVKNLHLIHFSVTSK